MLLLLVRLVELLIHVMTLKDKQCCSDIVYTGAPNSAKFRGVAEEQPRFDKGGGCNNFLLFTR